MPKEQYHINFLHPSVWHLCDLGSSSNLINKNSRRNSRRHVSCHRYFKRPSKIVTTPEESPLGWEDVNTTWKYKLNLQTHTTSSYSPFKGSPTEKIPISESTSAIARPFDSSSFDHIGFHIRTQPKYRYFDQPVQQNIFISELTIFPSAQKPILSRTSDDPLCTYDTKHLLGLGDKASWFMSIFQHDTLSNHPWVVEVHPIVRSWQGKVHTIRAECHTRDFSIACGSVSRARKRFNDNVLSLACLKPANVK